MSKILKHFSEERQRLRPKMYFSKLVQQHRENKNDTKNNQSYQENGTKTARATTITITSIINMNRIVKKIRFGIARVGMDSNVGVKISVFLLRPFVGLFLPFLTVVLTQVVPPTGALVVKFFNLFLDLIVGISTDVLGPADLGKAAESRELHLFGHFSEIMIITIHLLLKSKF